MGSNKQAELKIQQKETALINASLINYGSLGCSAAHTFCVHLQLVVFFSSVPISVDESGIDQSLLNPMVQR